MAHNLSLSRSQRGISLMGVAIIGALLVMIAIVVMKLVPAVLEYEAILKAVKVAKDAGQTVPEIQRSFDKAATIDDITSVHGSDLDITKDGNEVIVSFKYDKEIKIYPPVYIVLKLEGSSKQ